MSGTLMNLHLQVAAFLERSPHWGILGSFTGFGATLFAWAQHASVLLSLAGAVFGFLAGVYTFLIKRHQWKREQNKK